MNVLITKVSYFWGIEKKVHIFARFQNRLLPL